MYSNEELERFYFRYQKKLCHLMNPSSRFAGVTTSLATSLPNGKGYMLEDCEAPVDGSPEVHVRRSPVRSLIEQKATFPTEKFDDFEKILIFVEIKFVTAH